MTGGTGGTPAGALAGPAASSPAARPREHTTPHCPEEILMSSTFTPPGDGWIEGPVSGLIEGVGTTNTERIVYWHGNDQRVWHRPLRPLPTQPGYYLAGGPFGHQQVVELLNSPEGQWVDAADRNYLNDDDVRALGPLRRLVVLDDVIRYFRKEAGPDAPPTDWRNRAASTLAAEWEHDA